MKATSKPKRGALLLFSVAALLAGGASAERGQSALDGFDPKANGTAPTISIDSVTVDEAGGNAVFTVTQSAISDANTTFEYSTADGTAVAPGDYTAASNVPGEITAGNTTTTISVPINDDAVFEPDETFTVTLGNAAGATIETGTGTGTIQDNDAEPTFAISSVAQDEGDSGTTPFVFTVTKTGATVFTSAVDYATQDGTATAPSDYTALATTTLTFLPDDTSKEVTVQVNGDTTVEPNETFTVQLSNAVNATISDADGTGTITNDDEHVAPVVMNTNDDGPNSLRQALLEAEDGDTITFNIPTGDPDYNAGVWTITLTSGELVVDKDVMISGPGANVLVLRRDPMAAAFRLFHVTPGAPRPGNAPTLIPPGVTIQGMTLSNGLAADGLFGGVGGGIYNDHNILTVTSCTLSGNSAIRGAGIYSDGSTSGSATLTVINSTVSDNSASAGFGGGISNSSIFGGNATLTVVNCTLSGNSASDVGGGGIDNDNSDGGSAPATVVNSTLSGNSGTASIKNFGALTIGNTILETGSSGVSLGNYASGTITSAGYNLSNDDGAGFLTATGDQINTDPILGPLKNNGGPTLTHAPLSNSPAIDRGKDIGGTGQDQRGSVRPVTYDGSIVPPAGGDRSDIGAVELPPGVLPLSAVSRKTHGGTSDFDINLPLTGIVGVECRSGGATNAYKVIVTFAAPVTFSSAAVNDGTGSVATSSGSGTTTVTIDLTGVTNAQQITIALFGVDDTVNNGDVGVRMGVLLGDTSGNGNVNASDVSQTKARVGQPVNATNFRSDVTVSNSINASDVNLVKSRVGTVLP